MGDGSEPRISPAQRRPEITPGYDTAPQDAGLARQRTAQRRPEITPGYDAPRQHAVHLLDLGRSTKAGDYPRLRLRAGRMYPPQPVYSLNEGRRLPPATTRSSMCRAAMPSIRAQRRPEITPGYDAAGYRRGRSESSTLNEGRRLPPATTRRAPSTTRTCSRSLNEGRRLPPATTRPRTGPPERPPPLNEGRRLPPATTASRPAWPLPAGDSLNEGRRLPPATTGRRGPGRAVRGRAQRRPEITPGYDHRCRGHPRLPACGPLNEGRRLPPATTSESTTAKRCSGCSRSTKAGDYPRLRPASVRMKPPALFRALNEGRRLPPATTSAPVEAWGYRARRAQRRPEITPGYDLSRAPGWWQAGPLNEGRRLPPATTRRPPGTPPSRNPALNEGRRLPPATTSRRYEFAALSQ